MSDGFDISQLDNYTKKLISLANDAMPKESKKFIKGEGNKLNKKNKSVFNSKGIGEESGDLKKSFKSGKVYKYDGALSVRAYNGSPHAHLLDKGWIHKSSNGSEHFIPGFSFIKDAASEFEGTYNDDCEIFIFDLLNDKL